MPTPLTLEFSIELDHWKRLAEVRTRRDIGTSSIRVSRPTLVAIRELAKKISGTETRHWHRGRLGLDSLLAALAAGAVRDGHASPTPPPAKKGPAKKKKRSATPKGMHAPRPQKRHARQRPAPRHARPDVRKGMRRSSGRKVRR